MDGVPEKCEIVPKQEFLHLGFLFNTVNMTISCPPEKITRLQQLCSKLLNGKCTVLSLERTIGTIESVRPAVKFAALYYRSLQYQLLKAKVGKRDPSKLIILSQKSKEELQWWVSPAGFALHSSSPIREPQPTVKIWSDANLTRGGQQFLF